MGLQTEIAQIAYEFHGIGWDKLTEESKDIFREKTKPILAKMREVVESLNSIDYPYGADFKQAILKAMED